ncbi:hypothetical protein J7E36_11440 [Pseudomonas fluorescens]|nr:hypothetical protein [Pseudomonas fluorescens]
MAVLAAVLLFLLHASERVPALGALNVWAVLGLPLLGWVLAFGTRAYVYGGALSHCQFLTEEAHAAQQAWQDWAHRYLAVQGSCVLLPDQVSASVLTQENSNRPPRTGEARRITALPEQERAQEGLRLLLSAMAPTVRALPRRQSLRVTLLTDIEPGQYDALRDAWRQIWATEIELTSPEKLTLTAELSYQWIDETLKTASSAAELILVLQVSGGDAYSDGLAALLLRPDRLALACEMPLTGGLLRPMPLDINDLPRELPVFLQSQTRAREATGLLADRADWQPLINKIFAAGRTQGASLKVNQQWTQERLCGLPGPFSHWLLAAFGVEMARHQQRPLLMLTQEESRHWISTVTTGERA